MDYIKPHKVPTELFWELLELSLTELDILIQGKWLLMTANNATSQLLCQQDQGANQNTGQCDSSAA